MHKHYIAPHTHTHTYLTTLCAYIGARPLPSKLMIPENVLISLFGVSMFTLPFRVEREGPSAVTCVGWGGGIG